MNPELFIDAEWSIMRAWIAARYAKYVNRCIREYREPWRKPLAKARKRRARKARVA